MHLSVADNRQRCGLSRATTHSDQIKVCVLLSLQKHNMLAMQPLTIFIVAIIFLKMQEKKHLEHDLIFFFLRDDYDSAGEYGFCLLIFFYGTTSCCDATAPNGTRESL